MKALYLALFSAVFLTSIQAQSYYALQNGNFQQNWTDTNLITVNHNWSNVPSVMGFRGDNLTLTTGVDPQTVLADQTTVNVIANQTSPDFLSSGGVAEFHIANPAVALQGSGTADAPFIVLYMNTSGVSGVRVKYTLRDLDGSANNAVQAVALQYRIGSTGNFINLPAGFVSDATTGPSQATLVTSVNVLLPPDCNNRPQLQVRVITANANGSDEWVGIDDVEVIAENQIPLPVKLTGLRAVRNAEMISVLWSTATEIRNKGFEIQLAADGTHFSTAGFAPAKTPDGNSNLPLSYDYQLPAASQARYIRLRQINTDGSSVFSQVIMPEDAAAGQLMIRRMYPVPVQYDLHVIVNGPGDDRGCIRILNIAGQILREQRFICSGGDQDITVLMGGLMKGVYLLQIQTEKKEQTRIIRVLKE